MTPELWSKLAFIASRPQVDFDTRYRHGEPLRQACEALCRLGYLDRTETGPGGCVDIYRINNRGNQALEEYRKLD